MALEQACQGLEGVPTEELVALQARGRGDLSTIYQCVLDNTTLDSERLANASYELKTLDEKLSLLRINNDELLPIRVLIGGRAREVVVCPPTLRKQITLAAHKTSHQGVSRTYRMQRHWYWPDMLSMVQSTARKCDT